MTHTHTSRKHTLIQTQACVLADTHKFSPSGTLVQIQKQANKWLRVFNKNIYMNKISLKLFYIYIFIIWNTTELQSRSATFLIFFSPNRLAGFRQNRLTSQCFLPRFFTSHRTPSTVPSSSACSCMERSWAELCLQLGLQIGCPLVFLLLTQKWCRQMPKVEKKKKNSCTVPITESAPRLCNDSRATLLGTTLCAKQEHIFRPQSPHSLFNTRRKCYVHHCAT